MPLDKKSLLCYTIRVKTLTKKSKQIFFAQRAVGWCKTVKEICRIPLRVALRKRFVQVGGDGVARYASTTYLVSVKAVLRRTEVVPRSVALLLFGKGDFFVFNVFYHYRRRHPERNGVKSNFARCIRVVENEQSARQSRSGI